MLAVTANVEPTEHTKWIETERKKLTKRGIRFTVWDEGELSAMLKKHPRLVDDFFGRPAVADFLGEDKARTLGDRLDAVDVVAYRQELGRLYREVLRIQERGTWLRRPKQPTGRTVRAANVVANEKLSHPAQAAATIQQWPPNDDFYPSARRGSRSVVDVSAIAMGASAMRPAPQVSATQPAQDAGAEIPNRPALSGRATRAALGCQCLGPWAASQVVAKPSRRQPTRPTTPRSV